MSSFLQHAEEIFSAARRGSEEDCDLALLVGNEGGIHVVSSAGWGLEPLRLHHGARAAYRVSRQDGDVRLEARSAGASCVFETPRAALRPGVLLRDYPQYLLAQ